MKQAMTVLLALVLLAPGVGADHVDALYVTKYACASSEGRTARADCDVNESTYSDVRAPEGAPRTVAKAGVDSQGVIAPVNVTSTPLSDLEVAGLRPYPMLLDYHYESTALTDPALRHAEARERQVKVYAFDTLESTGVHFRLACGWDLTQTARTCQFYNPEADAETEVVRRERDVLLEDGHAASMASTAALARDHAPRAEAHVTITRVEAGAGTAPAEPWNGATRAGDAEPALRVGVDAREAPAPDRFPRAPAPHAPLTPEMDSAPAGDDASTGPESDRGTLETQGVNRVAGPPAPEDVARVAAAVAAAAGGGLILAFLAVLAHRHLTRRNALGNGTRRVIHAFVGEHPGATITEIAEHARVKHTTATYHLAVLEELGLVIAEPVGNRRHYFRAGALRNRDARIRHVLAGMGRAKDVVRALAARGPGTASDLAQTLGMTAPGVHWHLRRLERLGVVARAERGAYHVNPDFNAA